MIRRRYLRPGGSHLHVASNVDLDDPPGELVVLLHQTPRSWDEYREVLEQLDRPAMAVDTPGYGDSDPPDAHTIEAYADPIVQALALLEGPRLDLVGHHTGGLLAVEVAARLPGRIRRVVLSSTPLVDAADRARRATHGGHGVDDVDRALDGSHLQALWDGRAAYYPPRRDLLDRFLADALRADDTAAGHHAVAVYEMERRLPLGVEAVLCVGHGRDPFGMAHLDHLVTATGARAEVIEDGHIPLEHTAAAFCDVLRRFLAT